MMLMIGIAPASQLPSLAAQSTGLLHASESSAPPRTSKRFLLALITPRYGCSRFLGSGSSHLNRLQTSPGSKSNGLRLLFPWPGCWIYRSRGDREWGRHILSRHLQDYLYLPNPVCPRHGHREDSRKRHIRRRNRGPAPEWEEQRMIYDPKLILDGILEGSISISTVEMYALDVVQ